MKLKKEIVVNHSANDIDSTLNDHSLSRDIRCRNGHKVAVTREEKVVILCHRCKHEVVIEDQKGK